MKNSNRSRAARKHPVAATPIGGELGSSRILRARAASLNSSGSLLSRASRKASLLGRVSRSSCPGSTGGPMVRVVAMTCSPSVPLSAGAQWRLAAQERREDA